MKKALLLCLFLMIMVFCNTPRTFAATKSILVIESYHKEYAWDASYKNGIVSVLGDKYDVVFFQMDTKRISSSLYEKRANLAWEKYRELNPDLVILGDDNALKFLGLRFLKTNTPVVYLGINNNPRTYLGSRVFAMTGVLERPLLKRSVPVIRQIIGPSMNKLLILFDSGTTSKVALTHVFKNNRKIKIKNIDVDLLFIGYWGLWQKTVLSAQEKGYDAIIIGLYHTIVDSGGKHVDAEAVLKWTASHAPVPPFGFWDFSVGKNKTAGGLVLFGKTQGMAAASIAEQILEGKKQIKEIFPVVGAQGRYLFSRSVLQKFNLKLPNHIQAKSTFVD
jgi:ABC-type uncharacterized transport system substrate-binding protein